MSTTDRPPRPHDGQGPDHPAGGHGADTQVFDREINLRGIVWSVAGLVVVTLAAAGLMWLLLRGLDRHEAGQDPAPLPFSDAGEPRVPPAPRLQVAPGFQESTPDAQPAGQTLGQPVGDPLRAQSDQEDMADLRRREEQVLGGWIDRGQGSLQVPLDVAIDVITERGLAPQVVGGDPAAALAPAPPPAPVPQPAAAPPAVKREP